MNPLAFFTSRTAWIPWAVALIWMLAAGCTTTPLGEKPPVRSTGPSPPGALQAEGAELQDASWMPDPLVIRSELQRRQEALLRAKDALAGISSERSGGPETESLLFRIRGLEGQIDLLKQIQEEIDAWYRSRDLSDRYYRMSLVAKRLLDCLALTPSGSSGAAGPQPAPGSGETGVSWDRVRRSYHMGDCAGVLEAYEAVSMEKPQAMVPTDVRVMQGLCLSRMGRRKEAIRAMESILLGQAQLLDAQYLHYLLGNWLFEENQLDRAEDTFKSVVKEARERNRWADLASLRMDQIRLRRGETLTAEPPEAEAAPSGEVQRAEAAEQVPAGEPEHPEAAAVPSPGPSEGTEGVSGEKPPGPSVEEIRAAQLEQAKSLLESERYQEAVQAFQALLGSEYEGEAQKGIQEAQDRYAASRRREAASLVLKAHGTADPDRKKAFLVSALEILDDVNRNYPNNRYAAKIEKNRMDVIERIRRIDPNFQASLPASGPSERGADTGESIQ